MECARTRSIGAKRLTLQAIRIESDIFVTDPDSAGGQQKPTFECPSGERQCHVTARVRCCHAGLCKDYYRRTTALIAGPAKAVPINAVVTKVVRWLTGMNEFPALFPKEAVNR